MNKKRIKWSLKRINRSDKYEKLVYSLRKVYLSTGGFATSVHRHCCRHWFLSQTAAGSPFFCPVGFAHDFNPLWPSVGSGAGREVWGLNLLRMLLKWSTDIILTHYYQCFIIAAKAVFSAASSPSPISIPELPPLTQSQHNQYNHTDYHLFYMGRSLNVNLLETDLIHPK